jgi:hypothetical protein
MMMTMMIMMIMVMMMMMIMVVMMRGKVFLFSYLHEERISSLL